MLDIHLFLVLFLLLFCHATAATAAGFGVWKDNNNKKWWISPEGETSLAWPLTKSVLEKNSYRLKVRKMVGTKSTEGSLEVQYMAHGRGGTLENVQDGLNVRKTYKIIKNLREVTTLLGVIDI